ncbi:hypothetical protein NPIL_644081 [Nephila pilipes]|uniref:Uncharacterized protein n=1 Tax=Nephila pilipes TaxID=299642 RepID=A0A8X6Q3S9_NEPPI|nr:hypothetical protein NPIL_644081 [Nephila pilipes]
MFYCRKMGRERDCFDINKRGAIYDHGPSAEISIDSQMVKRALTWLAASRGIRSSILIIQLVTWCKE